MPEKLGQVQRIAFNMGTTALPVWRQLQNEIETSIEQSADKEEVSSKDTGTSKKYLKTLKDATLSCKAYDDLTPATNFLSYKEINTIFQMTAGSPGGSAGLGVGGGNFEIRLVSVTTGDTIETFTGFVDSLSKPTPNMGKIEFSFNIQPVSAIVTTTV
ncbi:hypothetical protein [Flavobacterium sp.]|jgi:hypothetical protein|uniref:hypothetical protein n=1 Tax=Flavobacterium sp. TaxID=239 RepID=UPI0037C08883